MIIRYIFTYYLLYTAYFFTCSSCLEAVLGTVLFSILYASWKYRNCRIEYCDENWVAFNISDLEENFNKNLYGQHIAKHMIPYYLEKHVNDKNPQKALVMAFFGSSGVGKNHVSKMIAKSLYRKELFSEFVHIYIATYHFPHRKEIQKYKNQLKMEIEEYSKLCNQSLFIFDEADKMFSEIFDVLIPYLTINAIIDGVDHRKNIFIFLSNEGGNEIMNLTLNFWLEDRKREDISSKDFESIFNKTRSKNSGGLFNSQIMRKKLIDMYVPFLPLEREHVKLCILKEFENQSLSPNKDIINQITNQLIYDKNFEHFSVFGCKKISHKIDMFYSDIF